MGDQYVIGLTRTEIYDPVFSNNQRTEFRFEPNQIYDSNIRVGNLSCFTDATDASNVRMSVLYSFPSGAAALIRNMYLYDGSTLIDQVLDFHCLAAFYNLLNPNGLNASLYSHINNTSLGFQVSEIVITDSTTGNVIDLAHTQDYVSSLWGVASSAYNFNTSSNSILQLNKIFGFLKDSPNINTYVMKELRLVIEYRPQSDLNLIFFKSIPFIATSFTVNPPELYCDKMVNVDPLKVSKEYDFTFKTVELEKLPILDSLNFNYPLNNFNGKLLNRLVYMNVYDDNTLFGNDFSSLEPGETFKLTVNQKSILAGLTGIDTSARKITKCVDAFGDLNMPMGAWDSTDLGTVLDGLNHALYRGKQSYGGLIIGEKINEMQLNFMRTDNTNILTMYVYGEVSKVFMSKNGQYVINYA
jgi:hypothetical protein